MIDEVLDGKLRKGVAFHTTTALLRCFKIFCDKIQRISTKIS